MITLKDYQDWLKGWDVTTKEAEIILEQASIVVPIIKQKIRELEEVQEEKNGE